MSENGAGQRRLPRWLSARVIAAWSVAAGAAALALAPAAQASKAAVTQSLSVQTEAVYSISKTAAIVQGSIWGQGAGAQYRLAYALSSSQWCASNGSIGSPEATTMPNAVSSEEVQAELSGLQNGSEYCVALEASEGERAHTRGQLLSFTAGAPSLGEVLFAEPTSASTAELASEVDVAGQSAEYRVRYAAAESEWCESEGMLGAPEGESETRALPADEPIGEFVEAEVGGLTPGGEYCAAAALKNETAEAQGPQGYFVSGEPFAVITGAHALSAETELVEGFIAPAGQPTSYRLDYAPTSSLWCSSEGQLGTPQQSSSAQLEPANGSLQEVQAQASALRAGERYCARLVASNTTMSVRSSPASEFTAGIPSAVALEAVPVSREAADVNATIDSAGQQTSYRLVWAKADESPCEPSVVSVAARRRLHRSRARHTRTRLAPTRAPARAMRARARGAAEEGGGEGGEEGTVAVSVEISPLQAGSEYCVQLYARNSSGETSQEEAEESEIFFIAGAPTARIDEEVTSTQTTALLRGEVQTAEQKTSYRVQYAPASSSWCLSEGFLGSPAGETQALTLPAGSRQFEPVQVQLKGLSAGSEYCAELSAENESGESPFAQQAYLTTRAAAVAPTATTAPVTKVGVSSATVEGTVNPGNAQTTYEAAYGLQSSQWCQSEGALGTPELQSTTFTLLAEDDQAHPVQVELANLAPESEYCAAITASNSAGESSTNSTARFSTAPLPIQAPIATTAPVTKVGVSSATVEGTVNPGNAHTTYDAAYGLQSSQWCQSEGAAGAAELHSAALTLPAEDDQAHPVQVELASLAPESEYCAAITAANSAGESATTITVRFSTSSVPAQAPSTTTAPVTKIGQSGATIEGTVDPGGAQTSYRVAYGLQSTQWCQSAGAQGTPEEQGTVMTLAAEDSEAHAVALEVGGLSPATAYCAAIIASNSAGESKPTAPQDFTTTSSSSPQHEGGSEHEGHGGVLGEEANKEPEPQLGSQAEVGTVSGTVTVKLKGTNHYVTLGPGVLISDGSEIEATDGRVRLTVSLPGGGTQTAEAFGGRFQIVQEADGFTKLVLTLPLTGCPRQALPKGSASAASILRNQPLKRHLWVTEKGGKWGTNGRFVSTSVEGTTWLTTDKCKRSIVFLKEGRLKVRDLVTNKTKQLTAGHSFTAIDPRKRHHKRHHRR